MSTISESAWPMPEDSTMIRSKPAAWQTAIESPMFCGERAVGLAGGQRAHEDPVGAERVHADPVAEQRAAGLALGGVDREDRDGRSGSSARKRRTSSSVSEDLPAPPVPVMPRTGAGVRGGFGQSRLQRRGPPRCG